MHIKIIWTRRARKHIAKHGVQIYQVDKAVEGKTYIIRTKHSRYKILCQYHGRHITVIVEALKFRGYFTGISARDSDSKEKRIYNKKAR